MVTVRGEASSFQSVYNSNGTEDRPPFALYVVSYIHIHMYISKEALSPVWYYSKATLEYDSKALQSAIRNPTRRMIYSYGSY